MSRDLQRKDREIYSNKWRSLNDRGRSRLKISKRSKIRMKLLDNNRLWSNWIMINLHSNRDWILIIMINSKKLLPDRSSWMNRN
jgi:hypothetical protein